MDTFSLQCFLMLTEQLNFTKAASTMNVSQPTLSRIIATLEREVGATLFNRDKQGISVTSAGREFAHYAETIIRSCEYASRRAQMVELGGKGLLRIGFLPIMCFDFLPVVMRRMKEEYPNVEVVLEPYSQDKLIFEVNEGNLDLVLIINWKTDRLINCEAQPFFEDYYCVALHRDHPLADRESIGLDEISDETCLFYKTFGDFRMRNISSPAVLSSQLETTTNVNLSDTRTVSDLIGLLTQIECGQGIGILPHHIQRFASQNTKFVKIRKDSGTEDFTFRGMMAWPRDNHNPALSYICNILRDMAKE